MKNHPPKRALQFLRWFCREDYLEEVEGNLIELFEEQYNKSPRKAKWNFYRQILLHFRPDFIRTFQFNHPFTHPTMFRHILLITLRGFLRNKSTFLINLLGLSGALVCGLLIYFWADGEMMVDKFHEKNARLYQLIVHYHTEEGLGTGNSTPAQLAETFKTEMPEVEHSVAVRDVVDVTLSTESKAIKADGKHASTGFFEAFSFTLLEGNANSVLTDPNAIVLSDKLALKLFNTTERLIGKMIEFQHQQPLQITGVFAAPTENSTMQFDFILPFEAFKTNNEWALNWNYSTVDTYVTLAESAELGAFNEKIVGFLDTKRVNSLPTSLEATLYSDLYLHGEFENGVAVGGRIEYIRLFATIAIFILLIACINFINLSTAKASKRLKEIGVKKVIGADRKSLIVQFLSESCVLAFLALLVAVPGVWLLLPAFSSLAGKAITPIFNVELVLPVLGITLLAGLTAGSYPAWYLSRLRPSKMLKSRIRKISSDTWVRKGLVVFQFTVSMVLIVSVVVVQRQIHFVQTQSLGYNKENVIHFGLEGTASEKLETFLAEVNQLPSIQKASSIGESIVGGSNRFTVQKWEGEENNQLSFEMRAVNYDLLETLDIAILEGRSFSRDFNNETEKIIFNEAAVNFMGLENPIGKQVAIENDEFEIIGITKNFHFASLKETIEPLFFVFRPSWTHTVMAKIASGKEKAAIAELEELYANFNPGFPLEYEFLDQDYQAQYVTEQRVAKLSKYFAILTIFFSCLGLFGLATFNAETKIKEIGIRKVLGASAAGIVSLLSKDFLKPVGIALIIASPIAWYTMRQWLDNFAYRIDLQWWMFALAGILALGTALLTVSVQSIRAALANPVNALKSE